MKPFLRPTSRARLAPAGWVAENAGTWGGREVEVVYDPDQHQVVLFRNEPNDKTRSEIADAGFRRYASDGHQEMWVRDKTVAAETGFGQSIETEPQRPAVSLGGRSL